MHLATLVLAAGILAGLSAQQVVLLIAGPGISFAVELLTKSGAPRWLKSSLAFGLATLAGVISTVAYAPGERWQDYALAVAEAWVLAVVTHYSGATGWLQDATADVGFGSPRPPGDVVTSSSRPRRMDLPPIGS